MKGCVYLGTILPGWALSLEILHFPGNCFPTLFVYIPTDNDLPLIAEIQASWVDRFFDQHHQQEWQAVCSQGPESVDSRSQLELGRYDLRTNSIYYVRKANFLSNAA